MTQIYEEWQQVDAERIIESLRAGVPIPDLAQKLPSGRHGLLEHVGDMLRTGRGSPLIVRANYGDGKTHFLQTIAGLALQEGHAVSMVSVSREAPLNNLGQLFGAVAAGTRIPGSKRTGLAPLLDQLQGRGLEVVKQLEAAGIPERLRVPVEAYLSAEMTHRDELLADISGQWLLVSRLQKILRDRGLTYRMAKYTMARDPIWLYHLLAELVKIAGLKGWLIVLDELELIGKTSIKARADAYSHLYTLSMGHELPRTVIVGAVASNYYSDVLEERNDAVRAPAWYDTRGHVEIADVVRRGIEQFVRADRLPTLSPDEMHTLLATVRSVHGIAYSWEPPPLDEMEAFLRRHVKGADEKLRTRIRMAVQWLDVWHQHKEEPDVVVWSFGEVDLTETDEPAPGGDDDNGPVTRQRLF